MTGEFLGRVPYARVARGDGKPILVLNGGQSFMQRPTPERMRRDADRVAAVLPDTRTFVLLGYRPDATWTFATAAADVAAIATELGPPVQLVGISYGGMLALRVAADHPDLVSDLVLLASAHRFAPDGLRRVQRQLEHAATGNHTALGGDFIGMFRRPWLNALLRLRLRTSRGRTAEAMNDPDVIVRGLRAVLDDPIDEAHLARITAKTLIVAGTRDQMFGDVPERTASLVAGAKLELFEGETHMVPIERRRDVAATLRGFL